jgi:hypothetical protein
LKGDAAKVFIRRFSVVVADHSGQGVDRGRHVADPLDLAQVLLGDRRILGQLGNLELLDDVGQITGVIAIAIGDDQLLDAVDFQPRQVCGRPPAGGAVVAAIDQDVLVVIRRDEGAAAVLDVEDVNVHRRRQASRVRRRAVA